MALNIIKLCVGCSTLEELESFIAFQLSQQKDSLKAERIHTTRMVPKRIEEILDGGSLYWVIKGNIQCRQTFLDIRPFTDRDGIQRCEFVLDPKVIPTHWQSRRAFQGWRYLTVNDAPKDDVMGANKKLPPHLRRELAELGLL
ncbi:DUF1489 family protein [Bartonella tamiae]|uniref:Lysophospholipase n=1 Tax=Bartonella tamiae Th239 TaxID=1094558 RepID=J0ZJX0_9HYPH|nr:DUF1489 family protein [Bartonella tamiae]EJF88618.1 hypothetical protein ME5_01169 [Bartonella tamiae Th239]EJF95132.1 hypothetical protein MEG_00713 [Bartonella tamiae Th307]